MNRAFDIVEIYLLPGQHYFGGPDVRVCTVLGSCISITLWHPVRRVGGMCHYMLPLQPGSKTGARDGRYADAALELLMQSVRASGARPAEYEVRLLGGGNMFPQQRMSGCPTLFDVSRNVDAGRRLLSQYGFAIHAEDVGGLGHRHVVFELWSGQVLVRHSPLPVAG